MTTFSLELVTPSRVLWAGEAEAVSMRTDGGEATFLANHSPFIAALDITVVRIEGASGGDGDGDGGGGAGSGSGPGAASAGGGDSHVGGGDTGESGADGTGGGTGTEIRAAVHGGFVHVDANRVVILGSVAELASDIDVERARRALEAATEELEAEPEDKQAGGGGAGGGGTGGGAGTGERRGEEAGEDAEAVESPPGGEHGAFLDPASPAAAVARAKVRLEAAGEPPA
jgi:F0F1-type ATP synthase epsilon subunit